MPTIIVKTQSELDALPARFTEYTVIEIRGGVRGARIYVRGVRENSSVEAWGNSSVVARGNSSVVAWGNSSVEARGNSSVEARENSSVVAWGNSSVVARENSSVEARENSSVEAYEFSVIAVLSACVVIKHLADYAMASLRGIDPKVILKKDKTATVKKTPRSLQLPFETWLERGYVYADGICQKFVARKKQKGVEVFTVESFPRKEKSYVVKRGELFSHGETVEKAIDGLRYKLADRDTSRFKKWGLKTKVTRDDAIQAYRAITGACEFGVKDFCSKAKIPKNLTVQKVIELTKGAYGNAQFAGFFAKAEGR